MLTEIQNDMLQTLEDMGVFKVCGIWQGDLENLLKQAQKTPSAHVALASGVFSRPRVIGDDSPLLNMGWDVIVIYQCMQSRDTSSTMGYSLIEHVVKPVSRGGLSGKKVQDGLIWPVSLDLIDTISGISAYAIRFEIERST
jgi:hypothetical protein